MTSKPHVYGASRVDLADYWITLRKFYPDVVWTARWPDTIGKVPESNENSRLFWLHDIADIRRSDVVLVVPSIPELKLRGALVEAGIAIGLGKHVVLVEDHPDYGTWQHHPLVSKVSNIYEAMKEIIGGWHECFNADNRQ